MEDPESGETLKARAAAWFETLRDEICAAFEALEDAQDAGPFAGLPAGRFEREATRRAGEDGEDAGGGVMAVMRGGRVFEKVGVNVSTVYGRLGAQAQRSLTARREVPGLDADPRFWASGISLVAHMRSPLSPAVHLNTRMFWTPSAQWFGGGADLNPMIEDAADTAAFHAALKATCDAHDPGYYPRFKAWADEYFLIRHRNEPRGVGGIFFDDLASGDAEADFAFVRDVGRAFLTVFLPITRRHLAETWTEAQREIQLIRRGRYAEFNLVYDRGTRFGLETGHNPEAVLMSLPPVAKWP
ncbi:MAG TPA: oxygen-dependent coproporphyrinogen oxidase [Amaricoccus sp.]|uniref:oxygen-dependent coproporphyrinogen oxidase n=1 Tax=Amaricoccus sp. TaxID=1872485 RepID=UPI002C85BB5E|nr:oxygen-dependent coproporphyrinogen oxidase [Amaricoccus sp.]HMQ92403.1 oxygen-dependent coproporphyrinogen oxidase [Amaricoccus sp.]HMR53148.1 oxygen-dependent coproporphyrinogen oxidase [Amaricoccus sp.]HMR59415.1 oxygen-dependent coproporphyrinogen oxidase [Amaricoccus sp.]HMT99997.1 oxygen-dependent coproporphyrinogen oxidase [Amaricoccus sp.]